MKSYRIYLLFLLLAAFSLYGCKKTDSGSGDFDVQFAVPESVTISGDAGTFKFRVLFGKSPLSTDKVIFGDPSGQLNTCDIVSVSSSEFTVSLYKGMVSGQYNVYIRRGNLKKLVGKMKVTIDHSGGSTGIIVNPEAGSTVYGVVVCNGKRISNAVVSDGVEVVKTDENGIYQLKSGKKHKYVFISVPSGYEVMSEGILPKLHRQLVKAPAVPERVDFALQEAPGQDNHTMLVFGDIHLARRTGDQRQFRDFTNDVNDYVTANSGKKIYGITLGDMTWDLYWYSNSYALDDYLKDANAINGIQIFHTIGNHDHDMMYAGDFETVTKYKKIIAPTYYSFNIGKVHYVVLDDIECKNTGKGDADSRYYNESLVQEQIDWLRKDLAFVPKTSTVVVTMHAPLFKDSGNLSAGNGSSLVDMLKQYSQVHVFTGHTHKVYNVDKLASDNIFEHNAGAICATWWWTSYLTPGIHIGQDGAPGGYTIVNVDGDRFKWQFKATGKPVDFQFRTYDRNTMSFTAAKYVPDASDAYKNKFLLYASDYVTTSTSNEVYMNVWNYDPSWKIEVTENGNPLKVTQMRANDPLHLVSYTAKRLNKNAKPSFATRDTRHFFKIKASSPSTTLNIKVTDRFGNIYKEDMARPKEFSTDIYK